MPVEKPARKRWCSARAERAQPRAERVTAYKPKARQLCFKTTLARAGSPAAMGALERTGGHKPLKRALTDVACANPALLYIRPRLRIGTQFWSR